MEALDTRHTERLISRRKRMENDKDFASELEQRIEQMENGHPEQIRRMTRRDYIVVLVLAAVCLLGILLGAFIT